MDRNESLIDRVDRRLGMLWARLCGCIAAIAGVASAWSVLTLDDFSLATYWPVLGFSVLMLVIARVCFRSRTGLMDQLSEVPLSRSEAAARRRDVAVDDKRSG